MQIKKRYVKVTAQFDEDGNIKPLMIYWPDGRKFEIEEIYDIRPAASLKAGGQGTRFYCRILNTDTYIFYENPKWFVEEKRR